MPDRRRQCTLSSRGASAGRCAHDEEVRAIRLSATGRAAAAACSGSRHRPASRGQVILDDLAHHHLARVAFPSGPRPLALAGAGEVRQDIDAVRRQVAGGQHVLRPDFAARRRRWPSRPTRGTASSAWRTAGREAGARGAGGRGAGPSADISLLSRGRGKLGADPVRTLFEHVAGPAGEDGAPGDVLLRAARDPVDRTTTDVPDSEKNAGFAPSR